MLRRLALFLRSDRWLDQPCSMLRCDCAAADRTGRGPLRPSCTRTRRFHLLDLILRMRETERKMIVCRWGLENEGPWVGGQKPTYFSYPEVTGGHCLIFKSRLFADYGSRVVTTLAQVWGRAAPSVPPWPRPWKTKKPQKNEHFPGIMPCGADRISGNRPPGTNPAIADALRWWRQTARCGTPSA